jgi:hypothetical protein
MLKCQPFGCPLAWLRKQNSGLPTVQLQKAARLLTGVGVRGVVLVRVVVRCDETPKRDTDPLGSSARFNRTFTKPLK